MEQFGTIHIHIFVRNLEVRKLKRARPILLRVNFSVLVDFTEHFNIFQWGSNVSRIPLHESDQMIRNCTYLLPNMSHIHTANVSLILMTVFLSRVILFLSRFSLMYRGLYLRYSS